MSTGLGTKAARFMQSPRKAKPYLEVKLRRLNQLLAAGNVSEAAHYAPAIAGFDTYQKYIDRHATDGFFVTPVQGHEMKLPLTDGGITQKLLYDGVHERIAARAFREELARLRDAHREDVTVVEFGGNIGYYTLLEADVLGEQADIHLAEPVPSNVQLLRENVERNGFGDRVTISGVAVGADDRTVEMSVSSDSNCGRVGADPRYGETREVIEVEQQSVSTFLSDQGLAPGDVDVVRMDVEGYEASIFESMDSIFESGAPRLLFVEAHDRLIEENSLETVLDPLFEYGFEFVHGTGEGGVEPKVEIQGLDEVEETLHNYENIDLVLRR